MMFLAPLPGLAEASSKPSWARLTPRSAPILLSLGPTRLPIRHMTMASMMSKPIGPIFLRNFSPASLSSAVVPALVQSSEKSDQATANP